MKKRDKTKMSRMRHPSSHLLRGRNLGVGQEDLGAGVTEGSREAADPGAQGWGWVTRVPGTGPPEAPGG